MNRTSVPWLAACAVLLTACQDTNPMVAPPAATDSPEMQLSLGPAPQAERVMPGRVLAILRPGADAVAVAGDNGLEFEHTGRGYSAFRGAVGSERALAARLGADARVLSAEPDYLRQTTAIDPRLWAFYNPGGLTVAYTRGPNKGQPVASFASVEDADEDNVEGYGAGGAPVSIASIDTGVDFGHAEFLSGQLVAGWDYYDNDADPSDSQGHGTHTTGTMVGRNVGVAGVAGAGANVTVHVYRVCGALGCPTSAIVSAIYDATDAGVVAMNLSLGGGSLSSTEQAAIQYATSRNALVIASAGNDGTSTVSCPACDPNAISVAASNWQDGATYYTNWGAGLDITAPGGQMYSNTTEEGGIYSSVPGGYAYYQGTSMAAPQVTGTAAIVASVAGLQGAALRARLEGTTDDLGAAGYDTQFGWGRLNSYRAVTGSTLDEGTPPPPPAGLAAGFTYSCSGLTCSFDGSGSTGSPTSYAWAFGDGGSGSGVTVAHTYSGVGSYPVTLTVSDGTSSDAATQTVSCTKRGPNVRCN
ncbi:MAG: S8 family serine peptidase [Gemmatimonadota bacterium]|nr:S8 family serine peptidase [Gemmatimonadota bacterium]